MFFAVYTCVNPCFWNAHDPFIQHFCKNNVRIRPMLYPDCGTRHRFRQTIAYVLFDKPFCGNEYEITRIFVSVPN